MPRTFIRQYCVFILLLILTASRGYTQQYNFKNFNTKNGLSGSVIISVYQDSKGYMWLGSEGNGVSKYDFRTFINYNKNDGLVGNNVTYITEDKKGNVWLATTEGVSIYDGNRFRNITEKEGLSKGWVSWIYFDKDNNAWLAIRGGGISKYDGNKFTNYNTKDGLNSNEAFTIAEDKNGNLWAGLEHGLAMYDGKKWTDYSAHTPVKNKLFFCSLTDSKGNTWFGGSNEFGVVKYNGKKFEIVELPADLKDDFYGGIVEDKKGNIWFATEHGVLRLHNGKYTVFSEDNGLASNSVSTLCVDYEDNIWIGSFGGGVDLLRNFSFVTYTDKNGLPDSKIYSIFSSQDLLMAGMQSKGLAYFKNNRFYPVKGIEELEDVKIQSINRNKAGEIYVGTENEGLYILKQTGSSFKLVRQIERLFDTKLNSIGKIHFDRDGGTWIVSYGRGVFYIDKNNTPKLYNTSNKLASDEILTLHEDKKGHIWLGTFGAGAMKYDGVKFINYTEAEGLSSKTINSITEDDKGNIYFATEDGGINIFNGTKFSTITVKDGLLSNHTNVLIWDSTDKALWAGTNKGINKITFDENMRVQTTRHYDMQDGFIGSEINQNVATIDSENLIYFGTNSGLCVYNREFDFVKNTPVKLSLNGIRLFHETVDWKKLTNGEVINNLPQNPTLSYKNNHLTFDFQALSTDNVRYTYILEGQDNVWSPLSASTEATISNISPGKDYVFKLKAINSNGVWSADTVSFVFSIKPPWWKTWWFYVSVFVTVGVSIYAFVSYRISKIAQEKKILEERVEERTINLKEANHKLSEAFREIKDSIMYAKRIQEALLPATEEITKMLPEHFIIYKPKDIVSGDFYWFAQKDGSVIYATADSTGHGVPGGFMSMLGSSFLNEIVLEKGIIEPAEILNQLRDKIIEALKQNEGDSRDGMDMVICRITGHQLTYAAANNGLYVIKNVHNAEKRELLSLKADKQPIGFLGDEHKPFTQHHLQLEEGDIIYTFTDGYADQFGGEKGKKMMYKRFEQQLIANCEKAIPVQGRQLDNFFEEWRTGYEQIDDVCLIGVKI